MQLVMKNNVVPIIKKDYINPKSLRTRHFCIGMVSLNLEMTTQHIIKELWPFFYMLMCLDRLVLLRGLKKGRLTCLSLMVRESSFPLLFFWKT